MEIGYIILVLIILLLLTCLYEDYCYYKKEKNNIIEMDKINFKDGDIIFSRFVGNNCLTYDSVNKKTSVNISNISTGFLRTFLGNITGSEFTHCAIIIIIKKEPYLYEITDGSSYPFITKNYLTNKENFAKPSLMPLKECLNTYMGHMWYYSYKGPKLNRKKILYFVKKMNNDYISGFTAYSNLIFKNFNKKYDNCVTLVIKFLIFMGVIEPSFAILTPFQFRKKIIEMKLYKNDEIILKNYYALYYQ